jgi:hypothetical protein
MTSRWVQHRYTPAFTPVAVTLPSLREGTVNKRLVAFAFSFRCRRILSGA